MKISADVSIEEQKTKLIEMQVENEKKQADSKGYTLEKTLKPYKDIGMENSYGFELKWCFCFGITLALSSRISRKLRIKMGRTL